MQGGKAARRQGGKAARRQGGKAARRQGGKESMDWWAGWERRASVLMMV